MGIASDSMGNIWVSDSGILDLPCEGDLSTITFLEDIGTDGENNAKAGVTLIRPMGNNSRKVTTFSKGAGKYGGLALPWGIAVDGNDNVFVCNFAGQRLTELCGVRLENCPPGKKTGDPISPDNGYSSDALTRNTGVQIDSSGNVWVMNNWLNSALEHQTNPGGHEVVVFVGLAAPIRMPLIGPPQQP
jgi:hypothetical protein